MVRLRHPPRRLSTALACCTILVACGGGNANRSGRGASGPVVLAAGNIASCATDGDERTATLLEPAVTVLALGDLVLDHGTAKEFVDCYKPAWGPYQAFTRPTPGEIEYTEPTARAYFDTFGGTAGIPGEGWYSYQLGSWHVVALNSNCDFVGGCGAGSAQLQWLQRDLAAHPSGCTLAYWHHPRYSSGTRSGGAPRLAAVWQALHAAGAELVVAAHEASYERFAALDGGGQPDPEQGMRQFVVGTGGQTLSPFGRPVTGSEIRDNSTLGVLRLVLAEGSYEWQFIGTDGRRVIDSGSDRCH